MSNIEKIFVMLGKERGDSLIFENCLIFGEEPTHGAIKYLAVPYILLSSYEELQEEIKNSNKFAQNQEDKIAELNSMIVGLKEKLKFYKNDYFGGIKREQQ